MAKVSREHDAGHTRECVSVRVCACNEPGENSGHLLSVNDRRLLYTKKGSQVDELSSGLLPIYRFVPVRRPLVAAPR